MNSNDSKVFISTPWPCHHEHIFLTQINACIFTSLILCKEELYFLYLKLKHNITNEQQNSSQKDSVSFSHLSQSTNRKQKVFTYQQALPMPWNLEMPSAENSLNSGFSLVKARIKSSLDRTKALFCSILFIVTKPWILSNINLILKEVKD